MNTSDIGPTEALWLSYCEVKGKLEEAQAQLKDARGEIRALRATEAGLRDRVKELEEGLAGFKARVNTLAALGLKAERFDFGGRLKYDMTALLEKQ